jgi:hypothetical protein
VKSDIEIREKLAELLQQDGLKYPDARMMFSKAAACKALLWALGENDDDRWHITAAPGPPVDTRARARN